MGGGNFLPLAGVWRTPGLQLSLRSRATSHHSTTQGRYQELVFMADLDLGKLQYRAQVSAQMEKLGLVEQECKDPEGCFHSDDGCGRSPG